MAGTAREWRVALALLVLAWVLLFFPQLAQRQVFTLGDAGAYRPFAEFSRQRWHELRVRTYWNPYTFLGAEAVASLNDARPQYLPGPLLDVAERLSTPAASPLLWLLLAHLAGALAVMVLARRLWGVRGLAALCGGLTWLVSVPLLVPFAFGHDAQMVSCALALVTLLAAQMCFSCRTWPRAAGAALLLALALALQTLHGHPQVVVYSGMLLVAFALQQAIAARAWPRLALLAGAAALGGVMSAAVWWPALRFSAQSFRGGGGTAGMSLAEVARYSLGWRDLLAFAWPRAVGFGGDTYWGAMHATDFSPYLGLVALVLAWRGRRLAPDASGTARFFAVVLVLAVLLTLGTTLGPVFALLRAGVPMWSKFRVPMLVIVAGVFALALLAARGAAREPGQVGRGAWIGAGAAIAMGLLLAGPLAGAFAALAQSIKPGLAEALAHRAAVEGGLDLALRAALAALALLAVRFAGSRPLAAWALPLLVAADLAAVASPLLRRASGPAAAIAPPPPTLLARVAARDPAKRAYVGVPALAVGNTQEAYTNQWVSWRARSLTGLSGSPPELWRHAMAYDLTRRVAALRAWGVGWLDLPSSVALDTSYLEPLAERAGIRVVALKRAPGRLYAPRVVIEVADADAAARALATPGSEPAEAAVAIGSGVAGAYPAASGARLRFTRDEPGSQRVETDAPGRIFLVIADSFANGWSATIDGAPATIVPANLLVRGLVVPGGRHVVEMRYRTPGMDAGVLATRIGLALWLLACGAAGLGAVLSRGP